MCRYVSLEQAIAQSADEYYQALWESTQGWHDEGMDPWPWLGYFVDTLDHAYRLFTERAASDRVSGSKQGRVRDYIMNHAPEIFRMADVRTALPGVSDQTIRLVLDQLRTGGHVAVEGAGRAAVWKRRPRHR